LRELTRASAGSLVTFGAPFLGRPDTHRLTVVEKYTGTTAYARGHHSYTPGAANFAENRWREPVPFDFSTEYGLAIAESATAIWLCVPSGVWSASLAVAALEVSADVIEAEVAERPLGGALRLVLRNDDGRYSDPEPPFRVGAEVEIAPGYQTPAGAESSEGPRYWIESIERRTGAGRSDVEVRARDASGLLDSWRARRQFAWAAGSLSVFELLLWVFGRAGLDFSSVSASAAALAHKPAFTVHAGESALTAVRRLLAMAPDVVFQRANVTLLKDPLASEAAAYTYGTDHALVSGRYLDGASANRAQVFGSDVFAEGFDWPALAAAHDRTTQVIDANLATAGAASDRATAVLRRAAIEAVDGAIIVRPNVGQELHDVVEVTDGLAGLSAAKRRVVGQTLRYSTERGEYVQRVELGGV
jgi:hypothetical protein